MLLCESVFVLNFISYENPKLLLYTEIMYYKILHMYVKLIFCAFF